VEHPHIDPPDDPADESRGPYRWCALTMQAAADLPSGEDVLLTSAGIDVEVAEDPDRDQDFIEWADDNGLGNGGHKLLGNPLLIQGDLRSDCVRYSTGSDEQDSEAIDEDEDEDDGPDAAACGEWVQLLQLERCEESGWDLAYGDLHFMIRQQDLAERRFDDVVCILVIS
jgi:hypothetical protein